MVLFSKGNKTDHLDDLVDSTFKSNLYDFLQQRRLKVLKGQKLNDHIRKTECPNLLNAEMKAYAHEIGEIFVIEHIEGFTENSKDPTRFDKFTNVVNLMKIDTDKHVIFINPLFGTKIQLLAPCYEADKENALYVIKTILNYTNLGETRKEALCMDFTMDLIKSNKSEFLSTMIKILKKIDNAGLKEYSNNFPMKSLILLLETYSKQDISMTEINMINSITEIWRFDLNKF